jgi:hypothetical protein
VTKDQRRAHIAQFGLVSQIGQLLVDAPLDVLLAASTKVITAMKA